MHEVEPFKDFIKSIGTGLIQAVRSDVDVFLLASAALLWPIKILRGLFTSTLIYVIVRRADALMSAYVNLKNRELIKANE